jgi:YVTN family beta-propeller protein
MNTIHARRLLLPLSLFLLVTLSCNGPTQATSRAETSAQPPPTSTPLSAPVALDLCDLVSAEDVSAALGEPFVVVPDMQTGACSFSTAQGAVPMTVAVSAAQGDQARTLVQQAASVALIFGGDAAALATAQELQANAATMPLAEVVDKTNQILAGVGYTFVPASFPGEHSTWGWNAYGAGSLQVAAEDTYLSINVTGAEEPRARQAAESLFATAQGRMPPAFTIELEDSFRFEYTAPTTAPEVAATLPSPVPTAQTVWVADRLSGRVARIDAASGQVVAEIPVGKFPVSLAVTDDAVWVANQGDGTLSRIDTASNAVGATYKVADENFLRIASGEGSIWVAACMDKVVRAIDPENGSVVGEVPAEGCWNVAAGGGSIWVPVGERTVLRVDPKLWIAIPKVFVRSGPAEIAPGFGSMWVVNVNDRSVSRFDPASGQVTATIPTEVDRVTGTMRGLSAGATRLWVATNGGVLGIDPTTDQVVVTLHSAENAWYLAEAGGKLWVSTGDDGKILSLDPATGEVIDTVHWGRQPLALAVGP